MAFLELELIEELFSTAEKQEIISRLREAMVSVRRGTAGFESIERQRPVPTDACLHDRGSLMGCS